MFRKSILFGLLVLGIALLVGYQYFSKTSYLDGAVIVEYKQNRTRGTNDYLTFRFYEKGTYRVSFSITPGKSSRGKVPQNFAETIEAPPRKITVEQYILADFLRVTITEDGRSESHDFS